MIRLFIKRAVGIKLHEEGNQWDVQADIMTGRGTGAGMVRYHAGDGRLQGGRTVYCIIISVRIERGWNAPDLKKQAQWRKIPCAGKCRHQMSGWNMWLRDWKKRGERIYCTGISIYNWRHDMSVLNLKKLWTDILAIDF